MSELWSGGSPHPRHYRDIRMSGVSSHQSYYKIIYNRERFYMWSKKLQKEVYGVIYLVINNTNNKVYVGQTTRGFGIRYGGNIEKYPPNSHLGNSIRKYGLENFTIIEEFKVASNKKELNKLEIDYIKTFKSYNPLYGYNKTMGGEGNIPTEETRKKLSESSRKSRHKYKQLHEKNGTAYWQQEEFLDRMSVVTRGKNNGMYGKRHTEESKRKMSKSSKGKLAGENSPHWGKPKSEETRRKISESRKGKYTGENNPMYGKTISEEGRRKISESNKRRCGENSSVSKRVKCLNTGEIFISATDTAKHFNLKRSDYVSRVCRGERRNVKHPTTGESLVFEYVK